MKFKAKIATNKVDANGEILSAEVLKMLAESSVGKQVSVAFIHKLPSLITESEFTDSNEVFVSGTIDNFDPSELKGIGNLYAVPGFIRDGDNYEMIEIALTYNPADENLTPIEFEDD